MKTKRGQTWSFDLIVAVVIFIVVVGIFYSILNKNNEGVVDTQALESNAKSISYKLNCDVSPYPPCFIEKGEINKVKLDDTLAMSYDDLKDSLGVEDDFCIYILDEENRVIPFSDAHSGIGSDDYLLKLGTSCSEAP